MPLFLTLDDVLESHAEQIATYEWPADMPRPAGLTWRDRDLWLLAFFTWPMLVAVWLDVRWRLWFGKSPAREEQT